MTTIKTTKELFCQEADYLPPNTTVTVFLKDEVILNKIVSKKARIKDILISGNLDPNGNYLFEGRPLDVSLI